MNQIFLEIRMFWLSGGEKIMTLAFSVLIQYRSVTDRQTDGQTDIPSLAIPAVCIARYANALVKISPYLPKLLPNKSCTFFTTNSSGAFRNLKGGTQGYISGVHFQKCSNLAFFHIKY